jgi:hypothetical protein
VTNQLNKWRNYQWSTMLESLDLEVTVEDGSFDESCYSLNPLVTPRRTALSDSARKALNVSGRLGVSR